MRHRKRGRKLNRTPAHRKALLRSLVNSLFMTEKNRIFTTLAKAKEARPFAEKLITLGRVKTLHRYRRALAILNDEASVNRLFNEIGPRYVDRPGGYTRIIKWPINRLGDNAPVAILELVGEEEVETAPTKKRRRKLSLRRKGSDKAAPETAVKEVTEVIAEDVKEVIAEDVTEAETPEPEAPTDEKA